MTVQIYIRGLQQAQAAMRKVFAATAPSGGLGRAIRAAGLDAQKRAIRNTPWDTTALRHSHRVRWRSRTEAVIDIDPSTHNPVQPRKKPYIYGWHLHKQGFRPGVRGGIRAFYRYTVEREGTEILKAAARTVVRGLP